MKNILQWVLFLGFLSVRKLATNNQKSSVAPTPTEEPLMQLKTEEYPQISLEFSSDAHFVTVNISNLHAPALEYNLIYSATVKKDRITTGVNASEKLAGKTEYSQKQLLGSESSSRFTYHQNIQDARLELTLRDSSGRSIFTQTYPFTLSPGKTLDLAPTN